MTVMHSTSDVADKAVSTEDGSEIVHFDAILAALIENKVESIRSASSSILTALPRGKWSSTTGSPGHSRLTSSSTVSSSHNHHRHRHDVKHHQHYNKNEYDNYHKNHHQRRRRRRYDSAPCENFISDLNTHNHHKYRREHRRASEMIQNPKYKHRHSQSSHISTDDVQIDLDSPTELIGLDHNPIFVNVERPSDTLSDDGKNLDLYRGAYLSQNQARSQFDHDDDDDDNYVALDIENELYVGSLNCLDSSVDNSPKEHYRRPRRKRKRKRKRVTHGVMMSEMPDVLLVDRDELPPRARWTIVATACLLFAMSILLVGVTLRMAPIIDDMVRKENEELFKSLNQDETSPDNSTTTTP